VTKSLSNQVSILNDPFEAFVWMSFVHLDNKSFLALVEAEDVKSNATIWLKMKTKMDLEYCETDQLARLYAGQSKTGRPEEQVWGQSAIMFANRLADHEKPKVCEIIFLHLSFEFPISFSFSFLLSVSCSFSFFSLNSLFVSFCLSLSPSPSLSLSRVLSLSFPFFFFFFSSFSYSLLNAPVLC